MFFLFIIFFLLFWYVDSWFK